MISQKHSRAAAWLVCLGLVFSPERAIAAYKALNDGYTVLMFIFTTNVNGNVFRNGQTMCATCKKCDVTAKKEFTLLHITIYIGSPWFYFYGLFSYCV